MKTVEDAYRGNKNQYAILKYDPIDKTYSVFQTPLFGKYYLGRLLHLQLL